MMDRRSDSCSQKWYEEGCRLTHAGKLQEAVRTFSSVIDCNAGWAEACFRRRVCYYLLGNCRLTSYDMDAATLLGCRDAQLWSRIDIQQFDNSDEE